jgi:DNA-binding winged helix-turn-helix (wHTH) protein/tetratricopeptide (TPR) repeat protein
MSKETRRVYEFGPYRVDPDERVLLKDRQPIPLPPKVFETLLILVEHSKRVVLKDDLMKMLWPDTFVEEANLSQNVFVLRKALGESAQRPHYILTVPGRGYRFAEKVESPGFEAGDLVVESQSIQTVVIQAERSQPWLRLAWAGGAVILLAGCLAGYWHYRSAKQRSVAGGVTAAAARRSVAVLDLHNLSGRPEQDWLSTALAQMLSTELAAGEKLRLVSGEDVAHTRISLPIGNADSLSKETLSKLRNNLGSDFVVLGSYTALPGKPGNRIRIDLRLQDAVAGETIAEVATTGAEGDLFDLVSQAGAQLRIKLGVAAVSTTDAASVRASLPSNPDAARLYSEGLAKWRMFDALAARDLLLQAIAADPKFPLAHSALADAWAALGYEQKAKEEATKAFQLAANLSREDRLVVEGHYREMSHQWDQAIDIYRALFKFFPDNIEYGLGLARIQTAGERGQDALATLDELRKLSPPAGGDPRIDQADAEAAVVLGDLKREKAAATKAAEKAKAIGAKLLLARARHYQCWALHRLGEQQAAVTSCEESKRLFSEAGDYDSVASLLVTTGALLNEQGKLADSALQYQMALATYRKSGDRGGAAVALNNLAISTKQSGDYAAAKKMYAESISLAREVEDNETLVLALGNLADLTFSEGDLTQAQEMFTQLVATCREEGAKGQLAVQLSNLAQAMYLRGNLSGAEKALGEAQALDSAAGLKRQLGYDLAGFGDVFQAEGKLQNSRQVKLEALKLREEIGDKIDAADARTALAELAIEESHPEEAESLLHTALADLEPLKAIDNEAQAYVVLVRTLLSEGKSADAAKTIARAAPIVAQSHDRGVHLAFAIVNARVAATTGDSVKAAASLGQTVSEATKSGYVVYAFEARLALGEIEIKNGHAQAGRQRLAALEKDAATASFALMARKAAAGRA